MMDAPRKALAWKPSYEGDELALGVALTVAIHLIPVLIVLIKAALPAAPPEEEPPYVSRSVVMASLLKLGKPIDPSRLPDRVVPVARTAPKREIVASREEPKAKKELHDAGAPPPPNTQESDIERLIAKSDPFAEDAGKARAEEGNSAGVDGGTETDPARVRAGDMYARQLSNWFHERWQIPSVISQGEANRLCAKFQVAIDRRMTIWHIRQEPIRSSRNDLFDDSVRTVFQKLLDDRTALPEPPPEVTEQYKGRTVNFTLTGDPNGDGSRCR